MSTRGPRKATPKKKQTKTAAPKAKKPAPRKKAAAPKPPAPPPPSLPPPPKQEGPKAAPLPFEFDPRKIEEALEKISGELRHWANKGRYTRVRFKFRGKQLLPDLPLAAVIAAEGLSFYWAGILRALIVNVAGGALVTMELVNDADKRVQEGREALLSGDVDRALQLFKKAVDMDRDNAVAWLNIGVANKLRGDRSAAREALKRAKTLDPKGPTGAEADRILATLPPDLELPGDGAHPGATT